MTVLPEFDGCACGAGGKHASLDQLAELELRGGELVIAANHTPGQLTQAIARGMAAHEGLLAINPLSGAYSFVHVDDVVNHFPIGPLESIILTTLLGPGISP